MKSTEGRRQINRDVTTAVVSKILIIEQGALGSMSCSECGLLVARLIFLKMEA